MRTQEHRIQTSNILGKNGEVIPETLDDIVAKIKKGVNERGYKVPKSKIRLSNEPIIRGYLESACLCTIELIQRGAANGGLDEDKYNLLTAQSKDFGHMNGHVNGILAQLAEERAVAAGEHDNNPDEPITEEEQAKLISEPTADEVTHQVRITTKDGGEVDVDKINNTVTILYNDGTTQTIDLVKMETWRQTAMAWLQKFFAACKKKVTTAVVTVGSFFSKLNPLKLFSKQELPVEVDDNGVMYYDPADLPEGSVPPRGAIARPKQAV